MSDRASAFFSPVDFFIFALLFWNQIFICDSFRSSSVASCCRLLSVKYLLVSNSSLSLRNCSVENAVRGRLSSCTFCRFCPFRDLGPENSNKIRINDKL